jgi:hypothetical protein
MHVRTASITDGSVPPRELRTVATLLTLTDSLVTRDVLSTTSGDLDRPFRISASSFPRA